MNERNQYLGLRIGLSRLIIFSLFSLLSILSIIKTETTNSTPTCAQKDPLLTQASLLLCASDLSPNWQQSDGWANQGTAGSMLNPKFDTNTSNLGVTSKNDPYYSSAYGGAPSVVLTRHDDRIVEGSDPTEYYDNSYNFYIPHNDLLDIPDTGAITYILDVTPLRIDSGSDSKIVWKYPLGDMPTSGEGWVIEKVIGLPQGPMVAAAYDGTNFAGSLGADIIPGRQLVTMRVDRNAATFVQFRNSQPIYNVIPVIQDLTNFGSVTSASDLMFGVGWALHNVAVYNRALSDEEIGYLYNILYSSDISSSPIENTNSTRKSYKTSSNTDNINGQTNDLSSSDSALNQSDNTSVSESSGIMAELKQPAQHQNLIIWYISGALVSGLAISTIWFFKNKSN